MRRRRVHRTGSFCCYCKRELLPSGTGKGLSMTWDHVQPRSRGGWKQVPCCLTCNRLKGDIDMEDWWWFVKRHPRYWKGFDHTDEVRLVLRNEWLRRGRARAAFNKQKEYEMDILDQWENCDVAHMSSEQIIALRARRNVDNGDRQDHADQIKDTRND